MSNKESIHNAQKRGSLIDQKLLELDKKIEWFYGDDFSLDQALKQYQDAHELAEQIEKDLAKLKNDVKILADFTQEE